MPVAIHLRRRSDATNGTRASRPARHVRPRASGPPACARARDATPSDRPPTRRRRKIPRPRGCSRSPRARGERPRRRDEAARRPDSARAASTSSDALELEQQRSRWRARLGERQRPLGRPRRARECDRPAANRSGKSVQTSTETSPASPWGLGIRPTASMAKSVTARGPGETRARSGARVSRARG